MRMTTSVSSSSTISVTIEKSFCTSLPDSLNHLEKSECELISISLPHVYLGSAAVVREGVCAVVAPSATHREDSLMASFWASARHKLVLPVPGGP